MDREQELLNALDYRFQRAQEGDAITVCWLDGELFHTGVFPNNRETRRKIAHDFAGALRDTWCRMTTVRADRWPRNGQRGLRSDTAQACVLWVDLDPSLRTGETVSQWRERTLQELETFDPKPTRVESSGRGLYPLWAIHTTDDWQAVEAANKWLAMRLGGDSGWDAAKILRLPGTLNAKEDVQEWATEVWTDLRELDLFEDFKQASLNPVEEEMRMVPIQAAVLAPFFAEEIAQRDPKLWMRMHREDHAREAGARLRTGGLGYVDRSANDYYIACALFRMGRRDDEVCAVLMHPQWFSGEKFRTSGYNEAYVLGTIKAATEMLASGWTNTVDSAERIMSADEYWYFNGDWYVYDRGRGMFDRHGLQRLKLAIIAIAGKDWTPDKENAVVKFVQAHKERDEKYPLRFVNVRNGMLDPLTGEIGAAHSAAFDCTYQIDAAWRPERVHTEYVDRFVASILPDDEVDLWWKFCGYCLHTYLPLTSRILMFLVGPAQMGKSELWNALRYFLGQENVTGLTLGDLTGEGNSFTTSGLVNSLLNIDDDVDPNTHIRKVSTLLKLATGGWMSIEKKGHTPVTMELPVKLGFASNGYPSFGNSLNDALASRIRVLGVRTDHDPFTNANPARRVNAHVELLSVGENRDAWLYRSVEGYQALAALNWEFPETAKTEARKSELERDDSIITFLKEIWDGREVGMMELFHKYQLYCASTGDDSGKWRKFSDRVKEVAERLGIIVEVGNKTLVRRR